MKTRKRVLMIAFHFPPQRGSSGVHRTLRFARYLPEFGWTPEILTVRPSAYEAVDDSEPVPSGLVVHRTSALDTSRDLAIRGRYPAFLARPDRWISWCLSAIPAGLAVIRRTKPTVLWSTYPVATAHVIGYWLARISGIPWVADFRDPMAQEGYPEEAATWRSFKRIESKSFCMARRTVFTTPGAARMYRERYPESASRVSVIENGYDEESFTGLEPSVPHEGIKAPLVLLHSGIVYPSERDPTGLFLALRMLRDRGELAPGEIKIRFRAPVHTALIEDLAQRNGVSDMIEIVAPLPYRDALAEMLVADGLLILQARNCNQQIPAKLYEYLRTGRPILGLTNPDGDTGSTLRRFGVAHTAELENAGAIAERLRSFIDDVRRGCAPVPHGTAVRRASRRARTADLAGVLNSIERP